MPFLYLATFLSIGLTGTGLRLPDNITDLNFPIISNHEQDIQLKTTKPVSLLRITCFTANVKLYFSKIHSG